MAGVKGQPVKSNAAKPQRKSTTKGPTMVEAVETYIESQADWIGNPQFAPVVAAIRAAASTCDLWPDLASSVNNLRACWSTLEKARPVSDSVVSDLERMLKAV